MVGPGPNYGSLIFCAQSHHATATTAARKFGSQCPSLACIFTSIVEPRRRHAEFAKESVVFIHQRSQWRHSAFCQGQLGGLYQRSYPFKDPID